MVSNFIRYKINLSHENTKEIPPKTCRKEKNFLFLQQIKRKNDGKRKYKLGRDIEAKQYTNNYGSGFYKNLSQDLKNEMPGVKGFSPSNLKYMSYFYKLYAPLAANRQQAADDFTESLISSDIQTFAEQKQNRQQPVDDFKLLFFIPWGHHCRILEKCKDNMPKALFFVRKTWENNWGRDALLNWLDTDLYERDGKAITNFQSTLPAVQSDLAQQITKDPYQIIQGTDGNIRISTIQTLSERL